MHGANDVWRKRNVHSFGIVLVLFKPTVWILHRRQLWLMRRGVHGNVVPRASVFD